MMLAVKGCGRCKLFEGRDQQPELYTVEATEPMDLIHMDFVNMETTIPTKKKTCCTESVGCYRSFYSLCTSLSSR